MTEQPTKLQRWIDIIAYLVGRRLPVPIDELMRNVPAYTAKWDSDDATVRESARRSFERDKKELREHGIPIRTVKYSTAGSPDTQEGYSIERRDFYLPYLKLLHDATPPRRYPDAGRPDTVDIAEADAPVALDALRHIASVPGFPLAADARSAFRKLAFDLDPHAFASRTEVLFVDRPGSAELADRLRTLSDALLARKRVTFRYHGIYRGEETSRDVASYGLLFQHGHWYAIGHDATRDDVRVFRVGRMEDVSPNRSRPDSPDYEIPAGFRLDDYVGRQPWELGEDEEPVHARVRFRFPLSLWAERNRHGVAESQATDGSVIRRFEVHQVSPFLRWLLSLEGEAEIIEPESLKDELKTLAAEVAARHGGSRDG